MFSSESGSLCRAYRPYGTATVHSCCSLLYWQLCVVFFPSADTCSGIIRWLFCFFSLIIQLFWMIQWAMESPCWSVRHLWSSQDQPNSWNKDFHLNNFVRLLKFLFQSRPWARQWLKVMPSTIRGKCTFYLIRIIHWTLDIHRIKCATITGAFFHENCVEIGRSKLFRVILVLTISTKQKKKMPRQPRPPWHWRPNKNIVFKRFFFLTIIMIIYS